MKANIFHPDTLSAVTFSKKLRKPRFHIIYYNLSNAHYLFPKENEQKTVEAEIGRRRTPRLLFWVPDGRFARAANQRAVLRYGHTARCVQTHQSPVAGEDRAARTHRQGAASEGETGIPGTSAEMEDLRWRTEHCKILFSLPKPYLQGRVQFRGYFCKLLAKAFENKQIIIEFSCC